MALEVGLPFSSSGEAVESLPTLLIDQRASVVAVKVGGHLLSLNYTDLRPGDVLLFNTGKPDPLFGNATESYQSAVFGRSDVARWRHVGILDANYLVWDAMPKLNVRARPLREVLGSLSRCSVWRCQRAIDADQLSMSLLEFSRGEYRVFAIDTGAALLARLAARGKVPRRFKGNSVICSLFVTQVLRMTTGFNFFKDLPIALPGDFSTDPHFTRVDVNWCLLVKTPPASVHAAPVQPTP